MSEAFWNGMWGGVFELIALGLVAGWVNLVYQRIRSRQDLRRDLIDEIDQFSQHCIGPVNYISSCLNKAMMLKLIRFKVNVCSV